MIDRTRLWLVSQSWFWSLKTKLGTIGFFFERGAYKRRASLSSAKANALILSSFAWMGIKSLFWMTLTLATLVSLEDYAQRNTTLLKPLSAQDKEFNIDQLRLYAQLLTPIFAIYFATIGIILSSGHNKLRTDIIQLLTREQIGSVYSKFLVFTAVFCLTASSLPLLGFHPGLFVYSIAALLTIISFIALFPLGQRLFNFFDLNLLVRGEIIPSIARHIDGAANSKNSVSLANHYSKMAQLAFEKLSYIDDRVKAGGEGVDAKLPALSDVYSALLFHYLQQKHKIDQESYWFPRQRVHQQWFLAGDSATSLALQTSSQLTVKEEVDHQWLENKLVERLTGHIEHAFKIGDFNLALTLIGRLSSRTSIYAERFQFEVGMREVQQIKELIEKAFSSAEAASNNDEAMIRVSIADAWTAIGSNLCLETLRRIMIFESELRQFFDADIWTKKSLRSLPTFLQVDLAFIVERIEFEREIEGQRLSKPKYIQQLAVQKLLQKYAIILSDICSFHRTMVPDLARSLTKSNMSEAATQVILSSLHSHWKLPRWFDELTLMFQRYDAYKHYSNELYALPVIGTSDMAVHLASARDEAIAMLGREDVVVHIFRHEHNQEFPDHFGQIYFELAEACIHALELNDGDKLDKVLPMFVNLAFLAADFRFRHPALEVNVEYRLHLISTVINDLASVMGFAILYGAYFDNKELSKAALDRFDTWVERAGDKQQYLKNMTLVSDSHSFSVSASPRGLIRINWKMAFESRARRDGFADQMGTARGRQHENKIVREFLRSHWDASHLFFAKHVIPQLDPIDFDIDHHISQLVRSPPWECKEDIE